MFGNFKGNKKQAFFIISFTKNRKNPAIGIGALNVKTLI